MKLVRSASRFHTRAVPSDDAVSTCAPSVLNDAELTSPSCPSRAKKPGPSGPKSHTRAVPSEDAATTCLPSALNDAEPIAP
jgi:hypothetical protein